MKAVLSVKESEVFVVSPLEALDVFAVRRFTEPTEVVLVNREDDSLVSRVTVLRYAGPVRGAGPHAFAVRDADGKFRVRSERQLGLIPESEFAAYLASAYDANPHTTHAA